MNFSDKLNTYLDLLDCSAKDICRVSNLSPTIVSRYLNGKRTPRLQSDYFYSIVDAICDIAKEKNIKLNKDEVLLDLTKCIESGNIDYTTFSINFNTLLTDLSINTVDFAKSLGYDASFISKIKNRTRKPADIDYFINQVGDYIVNTYKSDEKKELISSILKCKKEKLDDKENYKNLITSWLTASQENHSKLIKKFLTKLETFDLNDYINTDFSKIKVPTSPIILRNSKVYYGKERKKTSRG